MQSLRQAAESVARRLSDAGHEALFAGGCVRDALIGKEPKDYDIATSARPEEVLALFPGGDEVGAHFGVILVRTGGHQFEVATFRSDGAYLDGRHPESVSFTTAEEDAKRRDFTVNGLFEEPSTGEIRDYVGGRADLAAGIIRAIGDPKERFGEDSLRLLRAVRFTIRTGRHALTRQPGTHPSRV
jgi:poly(A) polymerase